MMIAEGMGARVKRAFLWHWHLLGFGTGVAFAFLSGLPAVWLPLVAAGELAYLGFLGLNSRFQNVLRGQALTKDTSRASDDAARYETITSFLTEEDLARFQHLQSRCAALVDLRRRMDSKEDEGGPGEDFRSGSLDRMLWLCLKLLHQRSGLERFLAATRRDQIEAELHAAEAQLAESKKRDAAAGGIEGRLTTSIADRIKTIKERLQNYDKAAESRELVSSEIEKTEQQITHVCEINMTMRDSAGLTAQIDSISESLQSSDKAFSHESIVGLLDDDTAPPLLSGPLLSSRSVPPPLRRTVTQ